MTQISTNNFTEIVVLPEHSGALRRMMSVWFGRWWWLVALILLIPVFIALTIDVRWWYVAIFIALMVYPTTIWMVYSFYATQQGASLLYCRKNIRIDDSQISIEYYNSADDEDSDNASPLLRCSKIIPMESIIGCEATATKLTIEWSTQVWDYVVIPYEAFDNESTAKSISERLLNVAYENRWNKK
ncbi:MAG: hypothetical protein K2L93_03805 [Muribaculaceae bacterium]|nr:hypothetical protein [Muribaculaceae bacterium]